jgi:ABC-type branched-subunit amino acid transport system substrate-binding protein
VQRRQFVSYAATALAAPAFVRNALAQEGGISGKSLTIGCSAALSGPLAGFGTDLRQGAEAAIAQINARGGVNGRALQLHMVDDGYVPQRTIDNVKQMIGQGSAFALLSCVGTPTTPPSCPWWKKRHALSAAHRRLLAAQECPQRLPRARQLHR